METPFDNYNTNSSGSAIIYQELLNKTNVGSLDGLESAVLNNRNLSNMTTNSLLNNLGTEGNKVGFKIYISSLSLR